MSTLIPSLRGAIAVPGWAKNELWRRARALPSLDLRFAENKSLVDARTGSNLVTFTRASTGTYVGADGLIKNAAVNEARFDHNPTTGESLGLLVEEQRTNLNTNSEAFDTYTASAGSVSANQGVAPNGTSTADEITSTGGGVFKSISGTTASTVYTVSVFAKYISGGGIFSFGFDANPSSGRADFDLQAGALGGVVGANVTSRSITPYGNGWYRCSVTATVTSTSTIVVFYSATSGAKWLLWGAQLEAGAFPTSYIPTLPTFVSRASTATFFDANGVIQTAGVNVARDNAFAPDSNGVMRPIGLLAEEQRTNLVVRSEEFDNASWAKALATVTANAGIAPNGLTVADKLVGNSSLDGHYVQQNIAGATSGTSYTSSVYAKAAEISRIEILHAVGATLYVQGFDLSNGTLLTRVTGGTTAATGGFIQPVGNGWYRCGITQTSDGTSGAMRVTLRSGSTTVFDATSQGVLIWGAQLEAGAFPTSYIPTLPTFVSRASTATFFDANGVIQTAGVNVARDNAFAPDSNGVMRPIGLLVEEQRTNLVTWSEQFDNGAWTLTGTMSANATLAPNGNLTADKVIAVNGGPQGQVFQAATIASGATVTGSVYIKDGGFDRVQVVLLSNNNTTPYGRATFNPTTGAITEAANSLNGGTNASASSTPVGNGWYRVTVTVTYPAVTAAGLRITSFNSDSSNGDGIKGVFLWGAQFEVGAFSTSYIPTLPSFVSRASTATFFDSNGVLQTAAVNTARSNAFLPDSSGVMRSIGLLAEEARTNSIRNNTMVGAVAGTPGTLPTNWSYAIGSGGLSREIVGTGTENGINYIDFRFYGTTTNTNAIAIGIDLGSAATGQTWTGSLYWKLVGGSLTGITASTIGLIENTSGGAFVSGAFYTVNNPSGSALSLQRVSATRTLSGGATVASCSLVLNFTVTNSTAIDFTLRIGLPQLEQGAFATSVIPTSGTAATRSADVTNIAAVTRSADVTNIAAATRSADVASITGTAFSSWYRQDEGTLFCDAREYPFASSASRAYYGIDSSVAPTTDYIRQWIWSGNTSLLLNSIYTSSAGPVAAEVTQALASEQKSTALAYKANDFARSYRGETVITDASGNLPVSIDRLGIGNTNSSLFLSGTIRRLTYWPARLANSTLQSITA